MPEPSVQTPVVIAAVKPQPAPTPAALPTPTSIAHAIALLAAGRDDLVVGTYLWQLRRQTGCSPGTLLAFAGEDAESRLALHKAQSRATFDFLQELDFDFTLVGGAIARVSVPYRTLLATGDVGDAAWAGVVVAMRCPHVPR